MANLYYDASKYIIALLFAACTFESFYALRYLQRENRTGIYFRQYVMIFLIHMSGFFVICLKENDFFYLLFFAAQELLFIAMLNLYQILYPESSRLLTNNMLLFLTIGLMILTRISREKAIRQFAIVVAACVISLFIPWMIQRFRGLKRLTYLYAGIGIAALLVVLILGAVTNGSKISYTIAGVTFQPSEFVKIFFILFLAALLSKELNWKKILIATIVSGIHVIILVCSRDLGSAVIFFVAYAFILFIATRRVLALFGAVFAGAAGSLLAYKLFYHVKVRVMAWLDPWSDITGKGYQIAQSLFALGTGGWFGLGLCQGVPESIPFVEADFIFSAIAEELGVLVGLCLIMLCVSCFLLFMSIALNVQDKFYKLTAAGIGVTYLFQVLLTIGGGTKFIPLTGVTLPLVSYGGSSVLVTICMFAILQGICLVTAREKREGEELALTENAEGESESDFVEEDWLPDELMLTEQLDDEDISTESEIYQMPVMVKGKKGKHERKKK